MTDAHTDPPADTSRIHDAPHAVDGEAHDEHGHEASSLGPIDWGTWAYAIAGGLGGLIVVAFFLFALGGLPS